jgi:thiamine-monophosphate kinase
MPEGSPGGVGEPRPAEREHITLADLGEWELIRRLAAFAPAGQFSDDAAVLAIGGEGPLVVNTDVLVEGIHFSDSTTAAADVGWRAAAANLSDLAAMGCGEVVGLTVGLVAPASTTWRWVEGVYGGLSEALARYGGVLLGGDCSAGAQRLLAVTAIGRISGGGVIRRGDGRPGDRLLSTGPHGLSRLGLALLQGNGNGDKAAGSGSGSGVMIPDAALAQRAITAHRRPRPRLDAVRTLNACRPAVLPWRVGGCDSSDGLAAAATAIAAASGCGARLERAALPLETAMAPLPEAQAWCLGGGEDFELVLALEPAWATALVAALPGTTLIGELVAAEAGDLRWTDGEAITPGDQQSGTAGGYSHFSDSGR